MTKLSNKRLIAVLTSAALAALSGCATHPSDEQVKQQAAQTTQQVKQGAEVAAANARVAAADAERKLNAVAAGVKEGLKSGDSDAQPTDINSATRAQLVALPGITTRKAERIIAARPYKDTDELVSRQLLTQAQYDQISAKIVAR